MLPVRADERGDRCDGFARLRPGRRLLRRLRRGRLDGAGAPGDERENDGWPLVWWTGRRGRSGAQEERPDVRVDPRFIQQRQGKPFVTYAGLLDLLHRQSKGCF